MFFDRWCFMLCHRRCISWQTRLCLSIVNAQTSFRTRTSHLQSFQSSESFLSSMQIREAHAECFFRIVLHDAVWNVYCITIFQWFYKWTSLLSSRNFSRNKAMQLSARRPSSSSSASGIRQKIESWLTNILNCSRSRVFKRRYCAFSFSSIFEIFMK